MIKWLFHRNNNNKTSSLLDLKLTETHKEREIQALEDVLKVCTKDLIIWKNIFIKLKQAKGAAQF